MKDSTFFNILIFLINNNILKSMRVLFLAPEPFFQERGTPIAIKLALQVLSQKNDTIVKVLCYNEGSEEKFQDVKIKRISKCLFIKGIRPGASIKKIILDTFLFFTALKEVIKHKYDVIHAIEESVFIAYVLKKIFGINYIYDMDSSLSDQVIQKWKILKIFRKFFEFCEKLAIKNAIAVLPMCDALANLARKYDVKIISVLRDISLNDLPEYQEPATNLREDLAISENAKIILYIGNLEHYQGIDLLIKSFALAKKACDDIHLIIIGGTEGHIKKYKKLTKDFNVNNSVSLIGPRPVKSLSNYLAQGDILASPRIEGENTSMKIYSYLLAGKPIIATDLPTHTQILNDSLALLSAPTVQDFAVGIKELLENPTYSNSIAKNAKNEAEQKYTFKVFSNTLNTLYDNVEEKLSAFKK